MNANHKGFLNIIVVIVVVAFVGVAGYFLLVNQSGPNTPNPTPLPSGQSDTLKVKLVDAFSEQIISNANVGIHSDNGIRCFTTPCNTESQEWVGKSDNNGFVFVPSKVINVVTFITATGYESGRDLDKDSEKITANDWLMELDPDSKIDNFERRLKLIDSQTQKPLSNISLWITNNQNCQPPECADYSFKGVTNNLGNVYYPVSAVKDNSWIFVNGYKSKKFLAGWGNYKVILEK